MRAGDLRHRVTIRRFSEGVQDPETGDMVSAWQDFAVVWAAVEPFSAREFIAAAAMQSHSTVRIVIRQRDITAKDRIRHRGCEYDINGVLPDKKSGREYVTLICSEVKNGSG